MALKIEFTVEAERDADEILEWLVAQGAGDTGLLWLKSMQRAIESLRKFPQRCSLAPENADFPFKVRHLLYGHKPHIYRILFTVEDEVVKVLHIRHGRRMPIKQ